MQAKSINGTSLSEVKSKFQASLKDGFAPTLAIVFLSVNQDTLAVRDFLTNSNLKIFGASSAGEFTEEGSDSGGIVILLLDVNPDLFTIVIADLDADSTEKVASSIGELGLAKFSKPAFIISAAPVTTSGEKIVHGLLSSAGGETIIIGGMAGGNEMMEGSHIFSDEKLSYEGMIALIVDETKIELKGKAVSGWKPVGTDKRVTKSEGNSVYEIDNQPALQVLEKFLGEMVDSEVELDLFHKIGTYYPLQVQRDNGVPLMRPPFKVDVDSGSFQTAGTIPQGSVIRFSLPPDFDTVNAVIESSRRIKNEGFEKTDAMIIFSCVGRLSTFGPLIEEENQGLQNTWNTPMAGFYTYGEFGTADGGDPEFHTTTCSWVALKEKQ